MSLLASLCAGLVASQSSFAQAPRPGLERFLGVDECGSSRWPSFYHSIERARQSYLRGNYAGCIDDLKLVLLPNLAKPSIGFECATAMGSGFFLLAQALERLHQPIAAIRAHQATSIFLAYDYQMKGLEFINQSPWPVQWDETVKTLLNTTFWYTDTIRQQYLMYSTPRVPVSRGARKLRVKIVSVCEYNAHETPLAFLSSWNKHVYAEKWGIDLKIYETGPTVDDPFSHLYTEPPEHRPPAWSKIDAVIMALKENYDWVMWMDCDSFFMNHSIAIHEMVAAVAGEAPKDNLDSVLEQWYSGTKQPQSRFDELLGDVSEKDALGWSSWLLDTKETHIIASEDGLMLNTGIFFMRRSMWSWRFMQKVRRMTFGSSYFIQHPWWEQASMMYLIQFPFLLHEGNCDSLCIAPGAKYLTQHHLNPYPPLIASALLTHVAYDPGDWIVSFSGCKIHSSQEVCNYMLLNYFTMVHGKDVSQMVKQRDTTNHCYSRDFSELQKWLP